MKFDYSQFPILQHEGESQSDYADRLEAAFDALNDVDNDHRIVGFLNVIASSAQQILNVLTGQAEARPTPVDPFAALYLHFEKLKAAHPVSDARIDEVRPLTVESYYPDAEAVAQATVMASSMGIDFDAIPAAVLNGTQRFVLKVKGHRISNAQPGQVSKLSVGQPLPWLKETDDVSKLYNEKDWNPLFVEPTTELPTEAANDAAAEHGDQVFNGEGQSVSITSASLSESTEAESQQLPEVSQTVFVPDMAPADLTAAIARRKNLSLVFDLPEVFEGKIGAAWKTVVTQQNSDDVLIAGGPGCIAVLRAQGNEVVMDIYGRLNAAIFHYVIDDAMNGPIVMSEAAPAADVEETDTAASCAE